MIENNKTKNWIAVLFILVMCLFLFLLAIHYQVSKLGEGYDYCIEWDGWIERDNMIYNCYDLTTQTFRCDYEILRDGRIMIKPILNITKDKEGLITSIIYGNTTYYNCTRWLKSKWE